MNAGSVVMMMWISIDYSLCCVFFLLLFGYWRRSRRWIGGGMNDYEHEARINAMKCQMPPPPPPPTANNPFPSSRKTVASFGPPCRFWNSGTPGYLR
jgi:hypothetical protein